MEEYLRFHARLRLPRGTPAAAIDGTVADLVQSLGLQKCAGSRIGDALLRGISGGEQRRLSIAVELLTRPAVLLVDEATTGLDATSAKRIVTLLRQLSVGGVTVVLSVHQPRPDIFAMMAGVLLLSGRGRTVFSGAADAAARHFAHLGHKAPHDVNIADFMLDTVIKADEGEVARLEAAFAASAAAQQQAHARGASEYAAALAGVDGHGAGAVAPAAKHAAPLQLQVRCVGALLCQCADAKLTREKHAMFACRYEVAVLANFVCSAHLCACSKRLTTDHAVQLALLTKRKLRTMVRHPWLVATSFGATLATAILLGLTYRGLDRQTPGIQNRFASFFFTILYLALSSLSALPIWAEERALCARERAAGAYGAAAYLVATVAVDLLTLRVLPPLFLATAGYSLMGLRGGVAYRARYWLATTMLNVAGAGATMAVGAATRSVSVANTVAGLCVLVNLLLSGFLLSLHKLPAAVAALSYLSYARYAYELLVVNEFAGAEGYQLTAFAKPGMKPDDVPHKDVTGDDILRIFFFDGGRERQDVLGLLALAVGYVLLSVVLLRWRQR